MIIPHRHTSGCKAVTETLRFNLKQRQALSSSKVTFVADRFRYQVRYFAVIFRGEITLVKRATRLLSSVEECWQVKLLKPLTVGHICMGINYPDCVSLDVLHIVPQR